MLTNQNHSRAKIRHQGAKKPKKYNHEDTKTQKKKMSAADIHRRLPVTSCRLPAWIMRRWAWG